MGKRNDALTFEFIISTTVSSEAALEIIKDVLVIQGVHFDDIVEVSEKPFVYLSVYFKSLDKANALKKRIQALKLKNVSLKIKRLKKADWLTKWKEDFKPFLITPTIRVVPAEWKLLKPVKDIRDMRLETGLSFGSGLHPTTQFMANLIQDCRGRFQHFLDIGTGTGILALVALMNDATSVNAIDLAFDAVKTTRKNLRNNGFKPAGIVKANLEQFASGRTFDFVAANLITQDLIKNKRTIFRRVKKGKYLAVSGISINNLAYLKREFRALPLRCIKITKGNGWSAILYKRL